MRSPMTRWVTGWISDLPTSRPGETGAHWRFRLTPDADARAAGVPRQLRVSWYDGPDTMRVRVTPPIDVSGGVEPAVQAMADLFAESEQIAAAPDFERWVDRRYTDVLKPLYLTRD